MDRSIVFIHGAWVTARCWDPFVGWFGAHGYTSIAPSWPYKDRAPAELRAAPPAGLAGLGVTEIVEHYASVIQQLPESPILIGHSYGGLFVQLLLDRGIGRAGVAISPAPPRGVLALYPSSIRSNFGVLARWGGWRSIVPPSFGAFAYGFLNKMSAAEQRRIYDEQATPETGRIFYQAAFALLDRNRATAVNFRNATRAPLLMTAGSDDHNVVPAMVRDNYRKYRSPARTDFHEFAGRTHWIIAEPGWDEVATFVAHWLEAVPAASPNLPAGQSL
ncbi:MAG TPA: alpha/beta hydrolase [Candidatus Limnocylindria bacterium]|nr:alpha/beta hydrolase [Candidatus Limnocylindria bacterium]